MKNIKLHIISIFSFLILMTLFISGCTMDDLLDTSSNGKEIEIKLKIDTPEADIKVSSRAPSENLINDIYIFIFDNNGNLKTKKFFESYKLNDNENGLQPNTAGDNNWVKMKTTQGKVRIYAVANLGGSTNDYSGSIKDQLDEISTLDNLNALKVTLKHELTRLGTTYFMTGSVESGNEININSNADIKTLKLKRLDSVITFNFKTSDNNSNFTLENYQVCNIADESFLFEKSATRKFEENNVWDASGVDKSYYDSEVITGAFNTNHNFTFYIPENRPNGKEITGSNAKETYGKREKQDKTTNTDNTVTNGAYTYAPRYGTYVILKGRYTGTNNGKPVDAKVRYVIHLGYVNGTNNNDKTDKANDFFSYRNCKYTYNITIKGVNDIVVEVEEDRENSPGAEGDVTFLDGSTKFILDAHYETVLMKFSKKLLRDGKNKSEFFTYKVSTPFTNGNSGVRDENWIHFIRNKKNGNTYSQDFMPYKQPKDGSGILTISEFIDELREIANKNTDEDFDSNNEVVYTCHVDEFYYNTVPSGFQKENGVPLWKYFVNTDNREAQILNDVKVSKDQQSSVIKSTYVISQRSIQTFYNTDKSLTSLDCAYGVETCNETGPLLGWQSMSEETKNKSSKINDKDDGRKNFLAMFDIYKSTNWNSWVNSAKNGYATSVKSVNAMIGDYNRAYLACMQRNRDTNGNGIIEKDEIKWYLPSINQYEGMFLGDGGLSEESRLYTDNNFNYKHFVTSTHVGTNMVIYWGEECISTSNGTEYKKYKTNGSGKIINYYRCMRNLGGNNPKLYYKKDNYKITTPYLNTHSTRPIVVKYDLGTHNNSDVGSRLSKNGFVVGGRVTSKMGEVINYQDKYYANTPCKDLSPVNTWRAPNIREFYLMSICGQLQGDDVARTQFIFPDNGIIGWTFNDHINMSVQENSNIKIRCVKDIQ